MKHLIFLTLPMLAFHFAWAGNSVNNGGDSVAIEFVATARQATNLLRSVPLSSDLQVFVDQIENHIEHAHVSSQEWLKLNGKDVDAINNAQDQTIIVSRTGWYFVKQNSLDVRIKLVLHEYIGVSGLDDRQYQVSQRLFDQIRGKVESNQTEFDKFYGLLCDLQYIVERIESRLHYAQGKVGAISVPKFCYDLGDAGVYTQLVQREISDHPDWFSEHANEIKNINAIFEETSSSSRVMCVSNEIIIDLDKAVKSYEAMSSAVRELMRFSDPLGWVTGGHSSR